MNFDHLCMGCMKDRRGLTVCPDCGRDDAVQSDAAMYLPFRTVLNNRYLIGRVLGQGGFGITYLAWDINLEIKIAIKEYFPRDLASRSTGRKTVTPYIGEAATNYEYGLSKFLEEAKVLARFQDHPGIVSVYEFFNANETAYMAMQYIDGMTLKEYLQQKGGKIPFKTAVNIMMPVMDALREVHGLGLLHRDISPDNIYITSNNQVKLLDFGAARYAMGEHSKSLSIILKQGYAPEEQYRSKGKQGPWTDVYAVAATIYRAITGQTPPDSLDRMDNDTVSSVLRSLAEISTKEKMALMKGLAVNATNRYRTINEFQGALLGDVSKFSTASVADGMSVPQSKVTKEVRVEVPQASPLEIFCKNHPDAEAKWRCVGCNKELCDSCVNIRQLSGTTAVSCRNCRDMCIELETKKPLVPTAPVSAGPGYGVIVGVAIAVIIGIFIYIQQNRTVQTPAPIVETAPASSQEAEKNKTGETEVKEEAREENLFEKDLLGYRSEMKEAAVFEKEAIDAINLLANGNYENNHAAFSRLTNVVIPQYKLFFERLSHIVPRTGELKEIHAIGVKGANLQLDAFFKFRDGMQNNDKQIIQKAQKQTEEAVRLFDKYSSSLKVFIANHKEIAKR